MGTSIPQGVAMDNMDRVLDKLDDIAKQLQELSLRVAKLEPVADSHKALCAQIAVDESKLSDLANRITVLETKLMVASSLAALVGGGGGLALAKLFGH